MDLDHKNSSYKPTLVHVLKMKGPYNVCVLLSLLQFRTTLVSTLAPLKWVGQFSRPRTQWGVAVGGRPCSYSVVFVSMSFTLARDHRHESSNVEIAEKPQ